jgi:hypothetical protein
VRAIQQALMRAVGKKPIVQINITVRPVGRARLKEISDLVVNLLNESGAGDETDTFTDAKLVSAHEDWA